jgi:hypothetical protein
VYTRRTTRFRTGYLSSVCHLFCSRFPTSMSAPKLVIEMGNKGDISAVELD